LSFDGKCLEHQYLLKKYQNLEKSEKIYDKKNGTCAAS
jgi:hypothetical protein